MTEKCTDALYDYNNSYFNYTWSRFKKNKFAMIGLIGIIFIVLIAVYAPMLANSKPLCAYNNNEVVFPFIKYLFNPTTSEEFLEKIFNYLMILITFSVILWLFLKKGKRLFKYYVLLIALVLIIPFITMQKKLDKTDWNSYIKNSSFVIMAPIPYSPYAIDGIPHETISALHWFGTDNIGRDVLSRIIYGTRISIAVGFCATVISLLIGTTIGLVTGYFCGLVDLVIMRIVEIVICFPAFLLLLILMAVLMDLKFNQSGILIIPIMGLLGWTGLSRIVRGEVLKQRSMQYIQACVSLGIPEWRIMFIHILPNVSGPIFISGVFMVASNVLAESGLSFLGFGVQPPTASWGELLKQAFADPLLYWNLTLWPGLLIFTTVLSFNLAGEGLRKSMDSMPK